MNCRPSRAQTESQSKGRPLGRPFVYCQPLECGGSSPLFFNPCACGGVGPPGSGITATLPGAAPPDTGHYPAAPGQCQLHPATPTTVPGDSTVQPEWSPDQSEPSLDGPGVSADRPVASTGRAGQGAGGLCKALWAKPRTNQRATPPGGPFFALDSWWATLLGWQLNCHPNVHPWQTHRKSAII